jgi:hypothetical protein
VCFAHAPEADADGSTAPNTSAAKPRMALLDTVRKRGNILLRAS